MAPAASKIIFDFERMKYPHTGLYHFCLELGKALFTLAKPEEVALYFFLNKSKWPLFDAKGNFINQSFIHKLILPETKTFQVWHATHQGTQYFPYHRKIPIVLTIHDLNFLHVLDTSSKRVKEKLNALQKKVSSAAHIVAISQFVLNELKQHIQLTNVPSTVIYNGCNTSSHSFFAAPPLVPPGDFLFSIGTITEKKNFHVLPALLLNNQWNLIIAGATHQEDYRKKIIAEASKLGVHNRIFFVGAISENDKNWYYKNCIAFVFPSLAEGFGLPVLEAMYYGKPVFLSTATSLPEIGGQAAYYFSDFEPESMQQTLNMGLAHYAENRPEAIIQAHALSFSWMNAAKAYLDIYKQIGN